MRVVVILLCLAFGGVAGCAESGESSADDAFGDTTAQDRAGFAAVGQAMSDFAHEYAVYARHVKQNNLTRGAEALDRIAAALDRAERVSFDSRQARHAVEDYLDAMRLFARSNARFVHLAKDPNSNDTALNDLFEVIGEAGIAAQRANRKLARRVLDTVAGDARRELAHAFGRVHLQLLRETDPEAYRRAVRAANDLGS